MAGRRELSFGHHREILDEVDRLRAGHERAGSWTLGQILHHLATAVALTADARPRVGPDAAPPDRSIEAARKQFFRAGRIPEGLAVPLPSLDPPPDAEEGASAEALGAAFGRLEGGEGPLPAHPYLGPLSRDEWLAFHRIHCAHHLGFVTPRSADLAPPPGPGGTIGGVPG